MKNTLFLIIMALISINMSCTSQKKSSGDNLSSDYQIKSSYLLIPVEEKAPAVKIIAAASDNELKTAFDVHLAVNQIDYWVPLDVKKWKDQQLTLSFQGLTKPVLGSKEIKQSDKFEFEYNEKYRPQFHFSPEYGWMNDPNGMVYLDGEYHLFYQYNPYGSMWGNMSWGHAVSTDLTSWTYLPVALSPDSLGAIFSGSAVIDKDNTAGFGKDAMIAIFTSAGKVQAQSIAYSTDKGRTFTKYDKNPVIANPDIPDFRDPKVFWHKESNQWVMALATKQTITFYGSPNLKEWSRLSEFGEGIGDHGGVWECPDLFPLSYNGKTKWVLLVSINPGGPNGGSATQYFVGDFDGKTFKPDALPYPLWIDYGRDNYAGVTWSNIPEADGRRIFIGWMSNWDYANQVPTKYFRSANTVPRELKLASNGNHLILISYPVKEINALKNKEKNLIDDVTVKAEYRIEKLLSVNEGTYEIEFTLQPENTDIFGFSLENTKNEKIEVKFDKAAKQIILDRRTSGLSAFKDNFASEMKAPLTAGKEYRIRLLVDKASVELFVNEGETVMTSIFFPTENMNTLRLFTAKGEMKVSGIRISGIK